VPTQCVTPTKSRDTTKRIDAQNVVVFISPQSGTRNAVKSSTEAKEIAMKHSPGKPGFFVPAVSLFCWLAVSLFGQVHKVSVFPTILIYVKCVRLYVCTGTHNFYMCKGKKYTHFIHSLVTSFVVLYEKRDNEVPLSTLCTPPRCRREHQNPSASGSFPRKSTSFHPIFPSRVTVGPKIHSNRLRNSFFPRIFWPPG